MKLTHLPSNSNSVSCLILPLLCVVSFVVAATRVTCGQTVTFERVALTGDVVPGMEQDVLIRSFNEPVINEAGKVVFYSYLAGDGFDSADYGAVITGSGESLSTIGIVGAPAPGFGPGTTYSGFFKTPVINEAGEIVFAAVVTGPGVNRDNDAVLYFQSDAASNIVAREGAVSPISDTTLYSEDFGSPWLNDNGQILFTTNLVGDEVTSTNDSGILRITGNSHELVFRNGDVVDNLVVDRLRGYPVFDNSGDTTFLASTGGSGDRAILSTSDGTLRVVARAGLPAPGTGPNVDFLSLGGPVSNKAGKIVFNSNLAGPGVTSSNRNAIFAESEGELSLAVRGGDLAIGAGPEATFFSFGIPILNASGQMAFSSRLTGPGIDATNEQALYIESDGNLNMVFQSGQQIPGNHPDIVFQNASVASLLLNGAGQVAFYIELAGSSVNTENDYGVFATDVLGNLHLIAREGDLFNVSSDPGAIDFRRIRYATILASPFGNDGKQSSFNDAGQLAMLLRFTDNTAGIFVARIPVPEPSSAVLVGMGGILLTRQFRRAPNCDPVGYR